MSLSYAVILKPEHNVVANCQGTSAATSYEPIFTHIYHITPTQPPSSICTNSSLKTSNFYSHKEHSKKKKLFLIAFSL